jgi:hypothetical protein
MGQHTATRITLTGAALLGALTAGALATVSLSAAPSASASCASFFGIGNTASCTSTVTSIAIAVGTNATAYANGLFGGAFAFGTGATAVTSAGGLFNTATALGNDSESVAQGYLSMAFAGGVGGATSSALAGDPADFGNIAVNLSNQGTHVSSATGLGNLSVNFLGNGSVVAVGNGDVGVNVGATGDVLAEGILSNATSLFGSATVIAKGASGPAVLGWAFDVLGTGNVVEAGAGPLAIAGSILQTGAVVTKEGPGINLNGLVVGGAAAVGNVKAAAAAPHGAGARSVTAVAHRARA